MIPALIIGRRGSRLKDKNTRQVLGRPLVKYPILAAKAAQRVASIYVSTDCPKIKKIATSNGCHLLERPSEFGTDSALAEDVFAHGFEQIQATEQIDFIVLLFANGATITPGIIDKGIEFLEANPRFDSAVTVSRYNMFSPLRARKIENGRVDPFVDPKLFPNATCDRDSQGDTYYIDCSAFIVRPKCFDFHNGALPFRWIGTNVHPLHQEAGCDVDFEWQFPIVEYWLKHHGFSETSTPYERR